MKVIKRHVGVDILGLPQVIHVTTANVTAREAAWEVFPWPFRLLARRGHGGRFWWLYWGEFGDRGPRST